jgi:hypothetical protein
LKAKKLPEELRMAYHFLKHSRDKEPLLVKAIADVKGDIESLIARAGGAEKAISRFNYLLEVNAVAVENILSKPVLSMIGPSLLMMGN